MDDEEDDDQINVKSENFVPLRALYSKKLVIPYPSARVLDNVATANALLTRQKNLNDKLAHPRTQKEGDAKPSTSKQTEVSAQDAEKKGTQRPPERNVLTHMSETTKGPLAFLKTCMDKRIRVKVWTRGPREIRGYSLGFVVAFDKHWNLALEDVQEKWTRKVKRKTFLMGIGALDRKTGNGCVTKRSSGGGSSGDPVPGRPQEPPIGWKAMGPMVRPPKVVVSAVENGKETCERHVNQMLIRGEQIAFISVSGT